MDFLGELPQELSSLPAPSNPGSITTEEAEQSLRQHPIDNDRSLQRRIALHAASQLPPDPDLQVVALIWAQDEEVEDDGDKVISDYIVSALATEIFNPVTWIECLDVALPNSPRLKTVLVEWGITNFEVS